MEGFPPADITPHRAADGLEDAPSPAATALAAYLASRFGAAARAVLHYGSRAQGRAVPPESAFDYFVVVSGYHNAYRAAASLGLRYHPRLAMFLAHLLPPNAMSARLASASGQEQEAKCLIISQRDFARACSTRARDHFVQTRMAQTVQLAWARDAESAADALARVRAARMRSVEWMGVFLPRVFDLPTFCRSLIGVLFAHEIRAESAGHPDVLCSAQDDILGAIYGRYSMRG